MPLNAICYDCPQLNFCPNPPASHARCGYWQKKNEELKGKKMARIKAFTPDNISAAMQEVRKKIGDRVAQKGPGIFVSRHELFGVMIEEYREFADDVHGGELNRVKEELVDIAVAAIFGIISIDSDSMDW